MKLPFSITRKSTQAKLLRQHDDLATELNDIKAYLAALQQGETDPTTSSDSEVVAGIRQLHEDLEARMVASAKANEEANWISQGLARFVDILRTDKEPKELYADILRTLIQDLNANQGGLFLLNEQDDDEPFLELVSCYAYARRKFLTKRFAIGEGMVGQCFLEKAPMYLTDVPEGYVEITSGLGEATARNVMLTPLIYNEQILGVLEIASFQLLEAYQQEYLTKLCENIASSISVARVNAHTAELLEASQRQASMLQAQEEELRQNMEEMEATQEEMARHQHQLEESAKIKRVLFESAHLGILGIDHRGRITDANEAAAAIFQRSQRQLEQLPVENLFSDFRLDEAERFVGRMRRATVQTEDQPVHVKMILTRYRGDQGNDRFAAYINGDISRELQQEKELVQLREELKRLKGNGVASNGLASASLSEL